MTTMVAQAAANREDDSQTSLGESDGDERSNGNSCSEEDNSASNSSNSEEGATIQAIAAAVRVKSIVERPLWAYYKIEMDLK